MDMPPPPAAIQEIDSSASLDSWLLRREERISDLFGGKNTTPAQPVPDDPLPPNDQIDGEYIYVDDQNVAQYAYNAGFRGQDLVTIIAIGISESGMSPTGTGDPLARANAIGDADLCNEKWDESIGIFQVRSLKDPLDPRWSRPDRLRVREQLFDPQFNAKAAHAIYQQKRNPERNVSGFQDWTEYVNGNYKRYIDRAAAAAAAVS